MRPDSLTINDDKLQQCIQLRLLLQQLKHLNRVVKANNGKFYAHNFTLDVHCTTVHFIVHFKV